MTESYTGFVTYVQYCTVLYVQLVLRTEYRTTVQTGSLCSCCQTNFEKERRPSCERCFCMVFIPIRSHLFASTQTRSSHASRRDASLGGRRSRRVPFRRDRRHRRHGHPPQHMDKPRSCCHESSRRRRATEDASSLLLVVDTAPSTNEDAAANDEDELNDLGAEFRDDLAAIALQKCIFPSANHSTESLRQQRHAFCQHQLAQEQQRAATVICNKNNDDDDDDARATGLNWNGAPRRARGGVVRSNVDSRMNLRQSPRSSTAWTLMRRTVL